MPKSRHSGCKVPDEAGRETPMNTQHDDADDDGAFRTNRLGWYTSTYGPGILKPTDPIRSPEGYWTTAIWSSLMYVPLYASKSMPRPSLTYAESMVVDSSSIRLPLSS